MLLPATKKARAYLRKTEATKEAQLDDHIYEEAYAEMMRWMLLNWSNMQVSQDHIHPHGASKVAMVRRLKECPPDEELSPEVLGLTTWDDVVAELDVGNKGILVLSDMITL